MHFPSNEKTNEQQTILQELFKEKIPGQRWSSSNDYRELSHQTHLRIWKTLRELDTMPVFIPHLREEIYDLLNQNSRVHAMQRALKKMLDQGKDMLKEWENK